MADRPSSAPSLQFVDRPSLDWTFADSVTSSMLDRGAFKLEFSAIRWDEPKPLGPPTGKQYPVARIVLSAQALMELANRIAQTMAMLKQQGAVKEEPQNPLTVS
jgi:hypothetical protein